MVASCWLFLYDLHYDARNHKHQVNQIPYSKTLQLLSVVKEYCYHTLLVSKYFNVLCFFKKCDVGLY